jgi:ABC-type phosphate transport system substrate-binding protein
MYVTSKGMPMQWLVALLILVLLAATLPAIISTVKQSSVGKGRLGGVSLALGLAFSSFLDPAKAAAIENVEKQKENRRSEQGAGGELID